MKFLCHLVISALSLASVKGIDLHFRDGMKLREFYEQGIYPRVSGQDSVRFLADPLTIYLEGIGEVVETGYCRGFFILNPRNEVTWGGVDITEPVSIAEATEILQGVANRFGVQPTYSSLPRRTPPSMEGTPWTAMAAAYKIPDSKWTFTLTGTRSEELVYLGVSFKRPTTRREDTEQMRERRMAPMLQSPEEWSHLPLRGNYAGFENKLYRFAYLISSYDEEGNLLPKFQKLTEEIEVKERARIQAMKNGPPPRERGTQEPEWQSPEPAKEVWNKWIGFALLLVVLASAYFLYQRRHRV